MTKDQIQQSERIATKIMRTLAIIGIVSMLALVTWAVVQGVRHIPNAKENLTAAVSAITSVFKTAPDESLLFEITNRTVAVGVPSTINWSYAGNTTPLTYQLSYACGTDVKISVQRDSGWTDLACDTPIDVANNSITILPSNEKARFADVMLTVTGNDLMDTTSIAVVNTDISTNTDTTPVKDTEPKKETVNTPATTTTKTPTPKPTQPVVRHVESIFTGPADLVLNIEKTGVLIPVAGENTFFVVSPIPTDKVAAVKFTVTNKGGITTDTWKFKAELPIEGDSNYEYTSPLQMPLASGMQIEFTLGFDELLQDDSGVIRITLIPEDKNDKTTNNTDSVVIDIKEV